MRTELVYNPVRYLNLIIFLSLLICGSYYIGSGQVPKTDRQIDAPQGLSGNWAVKSQRTDGTWSKAYFDLKDDGEKIRGSVRSTQFFYTITESTGNANGFTFTASMKDGQSDRIVKYEGKLIGDELKLSTRRR